MTAMIAPHPQQLSLSQPPAASSRGNAQFSTSQDQEELDEEELDDEDLEILGMKRGGRRHKAGIPASASSTFGPEPNTPTSKASIRSGRSLARDPTMKDSGTSDLADFLRATGPDGPPLPPSRMGSSSGLPEPASPSLTTKRSNGFLAKAGRSIGIGRKASEKNLKTSKSSVPASPNTPAKPLVGSKSYSSPASKELEKQKERAFDEQLRKSATTKRVLPNGGGYYPLASSQASLGSHSDLPDPFPNSNSTTTSISNSPVRNSSRLTRDSTSGNKDEKNSTASPSRSSAFELQSSHPLGGNTAPSEPSSTFVSDLGLSTPTVSSATTTTGPVSIAAIKRANAARAQSSGVPGGAAESRDGLVTLRPGSENNSSSNDSSQSAAAAIVAAYKSKSDSSASEDEINNSATSSRPSALARSSAAQQHGLRDSPIILDESANERPASRGPSSTSSSRVGETKDQDQNQKRSISMTGSTPRSFEAFHSAQPSPVSVMTSGRPADQRNDSTETSSTKSSSSTNLRYLKQQTNQQQPHLQSLPVKSPARKPPPALHVDANGIESSPKSNSKPQLSAIRPLSPFTLPQESQIEPSLAQRSSQILPQPSPPQQIRKDPLPHISSVVGASKFMEPPPFASYLPSPVDPRFPVPDADADQSSDAEPTPSAPTAPTRDGVSEELDGYSSFKGHSRKPSATQRVKAAMIASLGRSRGPSHSSSAKDGGLETLQKEAELNGVRQRDLSQEETLDAEGMEREIASTNRSREVPDQQIDEIATSQNFADSQDVIDPSSGLLPSISHLNETSSPKDLFNALQMLQASILQLQLQREQEHDLAADLCRRAAEEIQRLRSQGGAVEEKGAGSLEKEDEEVSYATTAPEDVYTSTDEKTSERQPPSESQVQVPSEIAENPESEFTSPEVEAAQKVENGEQGSGEERTKSSEPESPDPSSNSSETILKQLLAFSSILSPKEEESREDVDDSHPQDQVSGLAAPSKEDGVPRADEIQEPISQVQVQLDPTKQEDVWPSKTHQSRQTEEGSSNRTTDSSISQLSSFPTTPNAARVEKDPMGEVASRN